MCLNRDAYRQANREQVKKSCQILVGLLKRKRARVTADFTKKIEVLQEELESQCQALQDLESGLHDYVDGGQDYRANDILVRQKAAYEHVKDLASKDEKEKLYFIDKDAKKNAVAEEVKGQALQIDDTVLVKGAEEIKVLEEALNGKRFRLELKYRGTRDGFNLKNFHKVMKGM
jgi:hypothetical protein